MTYVIPMKWDETAQPGKDFASRAGMLMKDDSRPEGPDPTFTGLTTVTMPYDAMQLPHIKAFLTQSGGDPRIAFVVGEDGQKIGFRFEDQNEAATFKMFCG